MIRSLRYVNIKFVQTFENQTNQIEKLSIIHMRSIIHELT